MAALGREEQEELERCFVGECEDELLALSPAAALDPMVSPRQTAAAVIQFLGPRRMKTHGSNLIKWAGFQA